MGLARSSWNHLSQDAAALVEQALRAVSFPSSRSFTWFGKPAEGPRNRLQGLPSGTVRSLLLTRLAGLLYHAFYARGRAVPWVPAVSSKHGPGPRQVDFTSRLVRANAGRGFTAVRAMVREGGPMRTVVHWNGLDLAVRQVDLLDPDVRTDESARVRLPQDFPAIAPGFYVTGGDAGMPERDGGGTLRLYWNLRAAGAAPFVSRLTTALNAAGLPFQLKVRNDPLGFDRCDAGVLYLLRHDYPAVRTVLEQRIYAETSPDLKPLTPVFTKRLAPGLGLAEDPPRGESFGRTRCRLLAEGMLRAREQGARSIGDRFGIVRQQFEDAGLRLETAFLNPGSSDEYGFRLPRARGAGARSPKRPPAGQGFLETAHDVALQLSRTALWHRHRCTWLGVATSPPRGEAGRSQSCLTPVGPHLYGGTSGIGLFLAETYALTAEARLRRAALGALHSAWWRVEGGSGSPVAGQPNSLGFYKGLIGVALSSVRAAALVEAEELRDRAQRALRRALRRIGERSPSRRAPVRSSENSDWGGDGGFDVISGRAGGLLGLLILHRLLDDPTLLDAAIQLGEELLGKADRSPTGASWSSGAAACPNLTGLSHGSAGVALGLAELCSKIGDARYRGLAEAAFDYERHWFESETANWPDLRDVRRVNARSRGAFPFVTTWCHGAPGIALSRLRAYEIWGEPRHAAEARIALETTRRTVEDAVLGEDGNFSLCHGLAGNAEVLAEAHRILGSDAAEGLRLAQAVARFGIERYASGEAPWPCGVPGRMETPGLMVGMAGIGHFYLRLHDPRVPSILLPRSEAFALATAPSPLTPTLPA